MLECKSSLGETVKTKSADQILEELFTTLVKAPSDVEPPPPGDELPPISHQVTKIEEGSNETSKPKKKKKDKKKKKKRKKEDHDDNGVVKVKEKKAKKSKKEKKDRDGEEVPKVEESEPKSKRIRTEEKVVAEPKPEVAKPDEGHPKKVEEKSSRDEKLDKKIKDRDQRRSHENKESSSRSNRSRTSPARRRSSRSPNVQRRTGASSGRHSRSPHRRKNRSRSPSPYNNRRARRSSKSPIVLQRPKRSPSPPRIDKVQLLEVARQNLKRMQELGTLPANLSLPASIQQQNAGSSVPKSTGKTVAELTDYCKNLVTLTDDDKVEPDENAPTSFTRHPFQIKPRPDVIVMNIRNAVPLPVRKPEERVTLKQQFPVSSGSQHQDLEWVPVPVPPPEPSGKTATKKKEKPNAAVAPTPREITFPAPVEPPVDISTIVAKRISSIRKLQENQEDIEAQLELQEAEMMTQSWANYHHTNPLTGEPLPELINWSGAPQAWAKKDQFVRAAPVAGGVGMRLLQKMGWQPGEGLGRNKEGTLEPLAMDIKMDKKGLLSKEEAAPPKHNITNKLMVEFQGKHPVSILHEMCVKKRWEPPDFEQVADMGPDHLKHFLFKVKVNGIEYQPSVASTTKKEAKAQAAAVCLLSLGVKMTFQ